MKRFDIGARVFEPTYGFGSVIAVEDQYTRVQFDEHGAKKFLTAISQLEPSDEPPPRHTKGPAKPRRAKKPRKTTRASEEGAAE